MTDESVAIGVDAIGKSAIRRRRSRARRRQVIVHIDCDLNAYGIEKLVALGWLDPAVARDRDAVAEALRGLTGGQTED